MEAVEKINLQRVKQLLSRGADPNHARDFEIDKDRPPDQPSTPIRMAVFRWSDCMLEDKEREEVVEIYRVLVESGGDRVDALGYARRRYGEVADQVF